MPPKSIKSFFLILIAQSIAIWGSSLTAFGLGIWLYEQVGSVTIYALIAFANALPIVLLSPFAGTVVDRFNRKKVILASQAASTLVVLLLTYLFWQDSLSPWHIIALIALNSLFVAFVLPAVSATVPLMVPKNQLTRANGMIALAFGLIQLTSPAIAGSAYHHFGLKPILLFNLCTFLLGFAAIIITYIPQPHTEVQKGEKLTESLRLGFNFIIQSKCISYNIIFYSLVAAILISMSIMVQPMLLALTDAQTMGAIMSFAGSGLIAGSLFMILLKDVQKHMPIVLIAAFIAGLACFLTPIATTPWVITLGGFILMCSYPLFETNNRAILQRKIDPAMLGRVIGWRNFFLGITQAILLISAGLLADRIVEPGMQINGTLTPFFSELYGVGKGRGIAVCLSLLGVGIMLVAIIAYLTPSIRNMDDLMLDHEEPDGDGHDGLEPWVQLAGKAEKASDALEFRHYDKQPLTVPTP